MATYSYQDLVVWQKAMLLVEQTYQVVAMLPQYERYALADQMRRCAVSVPSNIAEGQKRFTSADTAHFLGIALGSVAELETQIILCHRLYNTNVSEILNLITEVSKMLTALIASLRSEN